MRNVIKAVCLLLAVSLVSWACSTASGAVAGQLPRSDPERVGVSSRALLGVVGEMESSGKNYHSLLVVKDGALILDAYFPPFSAETPHRLHSVNKSVLALAVGIAVSHGDFPSLDTPLADVADVSAAVLPEGDLRRGITLAHLLGNSSGILWDENALPWISPDNINQQYRRASQKADFFFSHGLDAPPGTRFTYNTGGYDLLARVLAAATGTNVYDYVASNLLLPLGITLSERHADLTGRSMVLSDLLLRPVDMAVLGQAMVDSGSGVIPGEWIDRSWEPLVRAFGWSYGLGWWIDREGVFSAKGNGGQRITVVPDDNLVIVVTAGLEPDFGPVVPAVDRLIHDRLLPVLTQTPATLPPDRRAARQLERRVHELSLTPPMSSGGEPGWLRRGVDLSGPAGSGYDQISIVPAGGELALSLASSATSPVTIRIDTSGEYREVDHPLLGRLFTRGWSQVDGSLVIQVQFVSIASDRLTLRMGPPVAGRVSGTLHSEVEGITVPVQGALRSGR